MAISDIFGSRSEQQNMIGRVDCSSDEVPSVFLGLLLSMGMTNPSTSTTISKKGVSVTKKGSRYTLVLEMFQPPLEISWTDPIALEKIIAFLNEIAKKNKKVGWVNILNLSDGTKLLQFATN